MPAFKSKNIEIKFKLEANSDLVRDILSNQFEEYKCIDLWVNSVQFSYPEFNYNLTLMGKQVVGGKLVLERGEFISRKIPSGQRLVFSSWNIASLVKLGLVLTVPIEKSKDELLNDLVTAAVETKPRKKFKEVIISEKVETEEDIKKNKRLIILD